MHTCPHSLIVFSILIIIHPEINRNGVSLSEGKVRGAGVSDLYPPQIESPPCHKIQLERI